MLPTAGSAGDFLSRTTAMERGDLRSERHIADCAVKLVWRRTERFASLVIGSSAVPFSPNPPRLDDTVRCDDIPSRLILGPNIASGRVNAICSRDANPTRVDPCAVGRVRTAAGLANMRRVVAGGVEGRRFRRPGSAGPMVLCGGAAGTDLLAAIIAVAGTAGAAVAAQSGGR